MSEVFLFFNSIPQVLAWTQQRELDLLSFSNWIQHIIIEIRLELELGII